MTIERFWPTDVYTRAVPDYVTPNREGKLYAQVIRAKARRSVHVAGTLSFDEQQNLVGEGSMATQYRTVLENIRRSLAAVGAKPSDVVRTTTYLVDFEAHYREGAQEWVNFFGTSPPVSTAVCVSRLDDPRCLVEIEAYAELD